MDGWMYRCHGGCLDGGSYKPPTLGTVPSTLKPRFWRLDALGTISEALDSECFVD